MDQDLCIGCGLCAGIAANVFEIGNDGKARVAASVSEDEKKAFAPLLAKFKELLNKNAFEISIWWLSSEKDELKKSLQKALP